MTLWRKLVAPSPLRTGLSIILTLGMLGLLLTQISLKDVLYLLSDISYGWLAVGVLCYLIANVGRALRLQRLLPNQKTRFRGLLPITIAQSMFNNILPARVGELSLLYFLKKYQNIGLDRGGVALIMVRISDYLAVAFIFIIAVLFLWNRLRYTSQAVTIIGLVAGVMILITVILMVIVWWGRASLFWIRQIIAGFGISSRPAVVTALEKLQQIIEAIQAVHSFRRYLHVFLWALFIWGATFAWFYAFMRGIGVQTTFLSTVVGATFAVLSKAVAFISIGGLGVHEAGWTVGFMLVGLDKTTAIASGFAVNMLTLLTSVVLGLCSWWILRAGLPLSLPPASQFEEEPAMMAAFPQPLPRGGEPANSPPSSSN